MWLFVEFSLKLNGSHSDNLLSPKQPEGGLMLCVSVCVGGYVFTRCLQFVFIQLPTFTKGEIRVSFQGVLLRVPSVSAIPNHDSAQSKRCSLCHAGQKGGWGLGVEGGGDIWLHQLYWNPKVLIVHTNRQRVSTAEESSRQMTCSFIEQSFPQVATSFVLTKRNEISQHRITESRKWRQEDK